MSQLQNNIKRFEKWFQFLNKRNISHPLSQEINIYLAEASAYEENLQSYLPQYKDGPNLPKYHHIQADEDILLVGQIGLAGTCLLGKQANEILKKRLSQSYIEKAVCLEQNIHLYPDLKSLNISDISATYTVSEGGLLRTLYTLGKDTGKGYHLHYKNIPVNQVTIEFCECLDFNPLRLFSCGCTLIVTPHGRSVMRELQKIVSVPVAHIGLTTNDQNKILTYADTESRINRPKADELLSWSLKQQN